MPDKKNEITHFLVLHEAESACCSISENFWNKPIIVKSYEIYKAVAPEIINEMFLFFREEDRNLYKTTLATLSANQKMRPQFIQKKPVADQIAWMQKALSFRKNQDVGEHLLQVWFMKAKSDLLVMACDGLGIEHNGEGFVEGELPETLDDDKLASTIDSLIDKYKAPLTTLYLSIFNLQIPGGWDNLAKVLETDKRLKLA